MSQRLQQWGGTMFSEDFEYDELNRLTTSTIAGYAPQTFTYDAIGNIKTKTGVGSYPYPAAGAKRPHAVSSIAAVGSFEYDDNGNMTSGAGRTVTWNSFDMPTSITKSGADTSTFYYGADHERVKQVRSDGTIWYAGAIEVDAGGSRVKTYLPNGIGVEIESGGVSKVYYTHVDRLGSVVAISDEAGTLSEQLAYDAWGKRRQQATPATPDSIDGQIDSKGFTGHEMLDKLDLVHMNGRVYDPLIARFISADAIIQEPEHSQSYNRYTYVWNNPTNLTDPTGFVSDNADKDGNCDKRCQQLDNDARRNSAQGNPYVFNVPSGGRGKDNSGTAGAQSKLANTSRNEIIREATLASPNPYVSQLAPCVGREGTCAAGLSAGLGGSWISGTRLGRAMLALFGLASEVQSVADGIPSAARGLAGTQAKVATSSVTSSAATNVASSAASNVAALSKGESILVQMNPKNLLSQQSKNEMSGSVIKRLEKDMRANGFDASQPISAVVRSDGRVVISDGHHRVQAAIRAGITEVPVDVYKP